MITLKATYADGSEQVLEVKRFGYVHGSRLIDYVDIDGPGQFYIEERVTCVYAMNSAGSTVGRYHPNGKS